MLRPETAAVKHFETLRLTTNQSLHTITPMSTQSTVAAPKTFQDVIELWDTMRQMADDVFGPDDKKGAPRVRLWRFRDRIPSEHWRAVVAAAKKRRFRHVTLDLLATIDEGKLSQSK